MVDRLSDADLQYHEVTREELVRFQQRAFDTDDEVGVRVAAECLRLMGLARMWKTQAAEALALRQALADVLETMNPDPEEGFSEEFVHAHSVARSVLAAARGVLET